MLEPRGMCAHLLELQHLLHPSLSHQQAPGGADHLKLLPETLFAHRRHLKGHSTSNTSIRFSPILNNVFADFQVPRGRKFRPIMCSIMVSNGHFTLYFEQLQNDNTPYASSDNKMTKHGQSCRSERAARPSNMGRNGYTIAVDALT